MEEPIPPRPTHSLSDRVAIVTGAGALDNGIGNGRASSVLLAADGCSVVCVDLDLSLAEKTVEMISSEGLGSAIALQADVSNESECKRIVGTTLEKYGRLDILCNIVGVGGADGTAIDVDMAAWAKGMEINVASMVMMAKYSIPAMLKNEPSKQANYRGSIINMGSVAGIRGGTPSLLYPTSKGAVVNMTRAMASHHAKEGIRVNCVCPGMVYTPMMYGPGMTEDAREARKNRSLLKVEGNGWDVGASVRFLAGEESRWITGQILTVDAGATCATGTEVPKGASVNEGKKKA